ncbi:MAG: hypothetical protein IKS67_13460, partial [Victivallales bacterium]|nr:hypothetical protein [Victivallales bacterium]
MNKIAQNMLTTISCLMMAGCASPSFPPRPTPVTSSLNGRKSLQTFENEFIRWEHDSKSGALTGAYVLNDSSDNILTAPMSFQIALENADGSLEIFENTGFASSLAFEKDGVVMQYGFKSLKTGAGLPGVTVNHAIHYGEWGDAEHRIKLEAKTPLTNLRKLSPIILKMMDKTFDTYGAKEMRVCGHDKWGLSGVADWLSLKTDQDEIYRCSRVPLYLLLFERGGAGIEYSMMSDISQWEALG